MRAALLEHAPRLALQPALHGVADLLGRGVVRQAHVQQAARHARQRLASLSTAPRRCVRGSSTMITVSPRKGSPAPSRQSTRAVCSRARARAARAACAGSSRAFSRSALSISRHAHPARRAHRSGLRGRRRSRCCAGARGAARRPPVAVEPHLALRARVLEDLAGQASRCGTGAGGHAATAAGAGCGSSNSERCSSRERSSATWARRAALHGRAHAWRRAQRRRRPRGRGGASRPRSRPRPRASARRARGRRTAIGLPIETSITPGRSRKLLRGQQRAEVTAIGTIGAPVAMASRAAPIL